MTDRRPGRRLPSAGDDRGSAALEFALVAPLVLLLGLAVVQVGLALHVRTTLTAAAAEGARVGALADRGPAAGAARTRAVLSDNLAGDVVESVTAGYETSGGVPVVAVRVRARLPLLGLLGPTATEVTGRAMREGG
ncbi:MAG: TadE/TadG family type IV pilus assembly protein [Candidatus Nanopelagicales bacterium]